MSREIKFRAWNAQMMLNRTLHDRNWYSRDNKCVCGAMPNDARIMIIMQFIGAQDKNGKDIYEGDIIDDRFVGVGRVEYIDKVGAFRINYENGRAKWFIDFLDDEYGRIEVIGNIHETPELLRTDEL